MSELKVARSKFDELLGKMIKAESLKRDEVQADPKDKTQLIQPRASRARSTRRKASVTPTRAIIFSPRPCDG
jgi:hypothetical protein